MLDSKTLDGLKFKQRADACVLASFAVAAYAFTKFPVEDYFTDYCRHYGLAVSDPEVFYAAHFNGEWKRLGVPGYHLIRSLYQTASQPTFAVCRSAFSLKTFDSVEAEVNQVEVELRSATPNALMVFLNDHAHSVTVAFDQSGPYKYDVNVGQVERGFQNLQDLGVLGSGFILTAR